MCPLTRTNNARKDKSTTLQEWAKAGLIPTYDLWNKKNPMADPEQCGRYRPDFVYESADPAEGVLLLEYDERIRSDRIKRCELVRMAEASLGYGGRPLNWIRYNPDEFKVARKTLRTSVKQREAVLLKMLQDMIGVCIGSRTLRRTSALRAMLSQRCRRFDAMLSYHVFVVC